MTPERWEQITEVYAAALELEPERRIGFLEKMCAGDETLRREVESLLAADSEAGDFIAEPIVKNGAAAIFDEAPPTLTGKKLGHYQIISHLGSGGMGEVYLGKDTRLNRLVAVKALPVSLSQNPNYLQRFQIEAEAAATLNHPNVATVYSVEEIEGQPVITMEYVEGKTLDKLIPAGGLDIKIFLEWFIEVAGALSHAHEKGIIHRDIKPGNIMITPDGKPKVLDFGLAQIERETVSEHVSTLKMTLPGQIIGTPSYMSPEQAEGRDVDARTDIFSLGVVMYEVITGKRPFTGDSYATIVSNLLKSEPLDISELKPETPYLLVRLINRCLQKQRRHRFQSMGEVRVLLEEIQAAVKAGVSMDSFARRLLPRQPERKWRYWVYPAAAVLVVALSVFAFYYFRTDSAAPPLRFENIALRKLSQTNNVVYAHISPDGNFVAYNTIDEKEMRSLWIRRVEERNSLQLLAPQPVFFWGGLAISNEGSQIFYITATRNATHGTLYRISSLGGTPRRLVETVNDLGSLSPDGSRILYIRYRDNRAQILSANAADGSDERVIHSCEPNQLLRDPQFSLDGKSVYFIKFEHRSGDEYWSLLEVNVSGEKERVILPWRKPKISEIAVLKDGSGLIVNATDEISNLPQLYHVDPANGKETRLTNDLNAYFGISVSEDARTIVSAQRNFARNIWVTSDGTAENLRRLTRESNVHLSAVWTPDGRIVFDAVDNNRPHIWIMNEDGTSLQQLTPNDSHDFDPRVSPDGRFIVFTSERTGERKVWRMNIDGSNPQLLTPVSGTTVAPIISPDGQYVYFRWTKEDKKVLGRVPLAGGEITEQPLFSDHLAAISPDGKQVAYAFYDEPGKGYKVGIRPLENRNPSIVFNITPISFLAWTLDGKGLIYRELEQNRADASTILLQPVTGGEPKPFLSAAPDTVFFASQTGDGKKTAIIRGKLLSDAVMLTANRPN